jgi:site-specific recombinase XerD
MLHQFFHFLKLNHLIEDNIALQIPYPKMEKTIPQYLTEDEYNRLLSYFYQQATCLCGLRNLALITIFGFLGLRLRSVISLNIEDLDLSAGLASVCEKGGRKRNKRISERTIQDIFRSGADRLGIEKRLHAHLFRHTAATYLNKVCGVDITQHVLGHSQRANTLKYTHLNPDEYAVYMRKHPFMNL